jgi:hypothetical protein
MKNKNEMTLKELEKCTYKISSMKLVKNKFGANDIIINKVQILHPTGEHCDFAKLTDGLLDMLYKKGEIKIRNPKK